MKFIKIKEKYLWEIRIITCGVVLSLNHKKAKFYGKNSVGWHIDCTLIKNTTYCKV